jgi:hypothetical protein
MRSAIVGIEGDAALAAMGLTLIEQEGDENGY